MAAFKIFIDLMSLPLVMSSHIGISEQR